MTSVQPPGVRPNLAAQAASRSGVSVVGSTETVIRWTSRPARSPSTFSSRPKMAPIGGQIVVQVVKVKFIATTRPRTRSL